ncbi:MAG: hypothetical protein AAF989_10905 [Planctomycetota bacterium]
MPMQRIVILTACLSSCLVFTSVTQGLTVAYGQQRIANAEPGCVGGWISEHGNIGFFRGDTGRLNRHLASLFIACSDGEELKVVLHAGEKTIENPEEQPLTGFGRQEESQLAIDWSVRRSCLTNQVLSGCCKCLRRNVTVDVWINGPIRLERLAIPNGVSVQYGREIEDFVESHDVSD